MLSRAALRRLWRTGLIAYLGLIALVSLLPPPQLPLDPGGYDKLWHAAAYALAGAACVPLLRRWHAYLAAGLALLAYGGLIEWLQGLGGVRTADPWDALANGLGALAGLLLGAGPLRGRLLDGR